MRQDQVLADLLDLKVRIKAWLKDRRTADHEGGRHETQLKTVETVLLGVAAELECYAKGMRTEAPSGELYEHCRKLSQASVWLERLWDFLRVKFDQRSGNGPGAVVLRAADEVVWSCYWPVIKSLPATHPAVRRAAAPLSYLEPEYSPAAVQFDRPLPPGLRLVSGDPTLDRCLERLPLPMLRLPSWCISAPWWLIVLGHEVGHHVQHELGLVRYFAEGIGKAVRATGLPETAVRVWEPWSEEIFADAFSVFTTGPWAVYAMAELEWSCEPALVQRKVQYPAPAIRLALMTRLSERLELDTSALVPMKMWEEMAMRYPATTEDWKAVEQVVDFILQPMPEGLGALKDLCDFDASAFSARKTVGIWAEGLNGIGTLSPTQETRAARYMASAALAAWTAVGAEPDERSRWDGLRKLADSAPAAIRACAEPGMRAGGAATIKPGFASELASLLLATSLDGRIESTP